MFHKRKYIPVFPEKYTGDPTNIIMRSSCSTDNRIHRYFIDFKITVKDKNNSFKTYLIEVKPAKQTIPPIYPGRRTQRYLGESLTYMKNTSKWKAAIEYAKDRNWEFKLITEQELGL